MPAEIPDLLVLQGDLTPQRAERYAASRYLAVDTETLGLNTHRDRLCLVQMCNEAGVTTLVQVTAARAPLLQGVLESPGVEKLFHYARFDMAALEHWLGIRVTPVYCTKIASRLARTYAPRHGLKDLARELLGLELNKEQQSSDWAAATLSPEQVNYAAHDVLHLVPLKERLDAMLERENRLELARAVMAGLPARVALDLAGWANEDLYAHV